MEETEKYMFLDDAALIAFIAVAGWFLMFTSGLF